MAVFNGSLRGLALAVAGVAHRGGHLEDVDLRVEEEVEECPEGRRLLLNLIVMKVIILIIFVIRLLD